MSKDTGTASPTVADDMGVDPTCEACYAPIMFNRPSGKWFHPKTGRVDCLKSWLDDSPLTYATPSRHFAELAETAMQEG